MLGMFFFSFLPSISSFLTKSFEAVRFKSPTQTSTGDGGCGEEKVLRHKIQAAQFSKGASSAFYMFAPVGRQTNAEVLSFDRAFCPGNAWTSNCVLDRKNESYFSSRSQGLKE